MAGDLCPPTTFEGVPKSHDFLNVPFEATLLRSSSSLHYHKSNQPPMGPKISLLGARAKRRPGHRVLGQDLRLVQKREDQAREPEAQHALQHALATRGARRATRDSRLGSLMSTGGKNGGTKKKTPGVVVAPLKRFGRNKVDTLFAGCKSLVWICLFGLFGCVFRTNRPGQGGTFIWEVSKSLGWICSGKSAEKKRLFF